MKIKRNLVLLLVSFSFVIEVNAFCIPKWVPLMGGYCFGEKQEQTGKKLYQAKFLESAGNQIKVEGIGNICDYEEEDNYDNRFFGLDECEEVSCDTYCDGKIRYYDGICIEREKCSYSKEVCEFSCSDGVCEKPSPPTPFASEQIVTIVGYDGNAQEPFITKDEEYLFFNNDEPESNAKDLFYAEKINNLTFQFKGEVKGVNTEFVDANPTMDSDNNFYFLSTRKLDHLDTLYVGTFNDGIVENVKQVSGTINIDNNAWLNMGVEITKDGETMYTSNANFITNPPKESDIRFAVKNGSNFDIPNDEASILKNVNTTEFLEYAGEVSSDDLELFYTRLNMNSSPIEFKLCHSKRNNVNESFSAPIYIDEPFKDDKNAFVEAPTLSADGQRLYYHKKINGRSSIYMLSRQK
jgi:hypothetical protein